MNNNKVVPILMIIFFSVAIMTGGCTMGAKESVVSEKYPAKPITMIVPFAAGGSTDMLARVLEGFAQKYLGQPLIVVNIPGGACTIGMNELAGASPDGYTIGMVGPSLMLQPLYGQTRYHYPTALEPLVNVISFPTVLATNSEKPWKDLRELISYAKQHPGEIKFGHSGIGTGTHVAGEMFAQEAGIQIAQVPFRGESEAMAALLGGHVQLICVSNPAVLTDHMKNGTVRILGVAEENRSTIPGFENVPTFKEQGVNISFNFWNGVAAPKGLPASEKARLAEGFKKMIEDPAFKKNMEELGMSIQYMGPDEFSARWIEDNAKLTKTIKETGIAELIAAQKK